MAEIQVTQKGQTITQNTTIMPEGFGGWVALSQGSVAVWVDGFKLEPGSMLDFSHFPADVKWNSPIQIICPATGEVRLTRLLYSKK